MKQINVADAKAQLSQLIDAALEGQEIVISRRNVPLVRLVVVESAKTTPQRGVLRGCLEMRSDFDAPLEDFDDYR